MTKQKNISKLIILLIIVFTFSVICGKLFFLGKRGIFGFSSFIIISSSMEPEYPKDSLIFIKHTPIDKLNVGDVIAYKANALAGKPAFHRITRFTDDGFYVKGDQNDYEDNQLITNQTYIGKGIAKSLFLGKYLLAIKTWAGFVFFLLTPLSLVVFLVFLPQKLKMRTKKL